MGSVSWSSLEQARPDLAQFGKERLDGKVSYLATVRSSGQPRVHPVTPVIGEGYCFLFVEPDSGKAGDLLDNGRYCLHCAMNDSSGSSGEFQITGEVRGIRDSGTRRLAESVSSYRPSARSLLFELQLTEVLAVAYPGGRPKRDKWTVAMVNA